MTKKDKSPVGGLYPYAERFGVISNFPEKGRPREEILRELSEVAKEEIDGNNLIEMLEVFDRTVAEKGKVEGGEKTMYDVISKSADLLRDKGSLSLEDLQQLAEETKDMIATKGRAAYFKEKSKGTIDPGAQSAVYIIHALGAGVEK